MTHALEHPTPAEWHDGVRYRVPSLTNPHESYLVDIEDFNGNGSCQCMHFQTRLGPLLSGMVTPARAVDEKKVRLKPGQDPRDALCCQHILDARRQFITDGIAAIKADRQRRKNENRVSTSA